MVAVVGRRTALAGDPHSSGVTVQWMDAGRNEYGEPMAKLMLLAHRLLHL